MLCIPTLLGLLAAGSTLANTIQTHIYYAVVPDIFQQDNPSTNSSTFNFMASDFGLIDRDFPSDCTYPGIITRVTQWQRLSHFITWLNDNAGNSTRYALLFLGRHAQGYHNEGEGYYGKPAWNCYWAELEGNGTSTWADAHLTDTGKLEALEMHRFWKHLITERKITPPQTYYSSPLYRCLQTAEFTFGGLPLPKSSPFKPVVKEGFRELVDQTCNHRSNRTYLQAEFPNFRFEEGFPEEDPLWMPHYGETTEAQDARSKRVLDDVFGSDASTYISVTAHTMEIASLLKVLGHRVFDLEKTGSAIPVLVKVTTVQGRSKTGSAFPVLVEVTTVRRRDPTPTAPAMTPKSACTTPPTITAASCDDCSCCT